MAKTNQTITLHGNPVEVSGKIISEGSQMPEVILTNNELKDVNLKDCKGKVLVLSVIPSIDTPTCQLQTRRFNQEATQLSDDVEIIAVSRDLPFALKRWCAAEGVERVTCLSDYKYRTFGQAFGVDVANIAILARAVFVIGKDQSVKLVQYVDEVSSEPNYDEVLKAVNDLL